MFLPVGLHTKVLDTSQFFYTLPTIPLGRIEKL